MPCSTNTHNLIKELDWGIFYSSPLPFSFSFSLPSLFITNCLYRANNITLSLNYNLVPITGLLFWNKPYSHKFTFPSSYNWFLGSVKQKNKERNINRLFYTLDKQKIVMYGWDVYNAVLWDIIHGFCILFFTFNQLRERDHEGFGLH